MSESLRRLYGHSQRLWYAVLDRLGDIAWAVEQDEQIAAALRMYNRSLASSLVRQHVAAFQRAIKEVL